MFTKKMRIVLMATLALCLAGAVGAQAAQAAKLLHRGRNVIHTRCGGSAHPVTLEVTAPRISSQPGPCVLVIRPNCPAGACRPCNIVVRVIQRFANQRPVQVLLRPTMPHRRCNITVRHIQLPVYANPCAKPCARPCVRPVPPVAIVPTPPRRPAWPHRPHRPVRPDWVHPVGPPAPPIPGPIVDRFPPNGSQDNGDIDTLVPDHMEPNTNLPDLGSNTLNQGEIAPNPGADINNPTLGHGTPVIPN